jgi:tetratricopeptide (TPR) repeat protein
MLEATECATGASLAREQGQTPRVENVLATLGEMATRLRTRVGESLRSVQAFDVPVAQATTPSLEALKAYTLGIEQRRRGAEVEAIPFLERALEIDPGFAAAATTLSTVYGNLGEASKSVEYARLAYQHRAKVSERERLFITYQYHDRVTGDMQEAAGALNVWKQTYRSDFEPANALALLDNRLGRYDLGVQEAREALERMPGHPFALSNLAYAYRALGRAAEAKQVAEQAVTLGVATVPTRRLLYHALVLEGDLAAAQRQLDWAAGNPREFDLVAAQAQVAAYQGRLRRASQLYRTTRELAERRGLPEVALSYVAHDALAHALYGDRAAALLQARTALSAPRAGDAADVLPRLRAMTVLGLLGAPEAAVLVREVGELRPQSTLARFVVLPTTKAAIELARGRAAEALVELRAAAAYETGTAAALIPIYLRGLAQLELRRAAPAVSEFERILQNRGVDPFSPVCAMAELGMARALAAAGERERSAAAYRALLDIWSGADPDLPALLLARDEVGRLSGSKP